MLPHRLALALAVPLLFVAGCSGDKPDAVDDAGSSTTATATETATGTAEVEYPAEGLDLIDRPTMEGAYERALQTYIDFERGRREAAREGKVGRLLSFNGTASVVDPYRRAVTTYADGGYDGVVAIEFLDARTRDTVLVIDICVDATELVVPDRAPALLGEATRAPQRIQVTNIVGPWRVTKAAPVDGTC